MNMKFKKSTQEQIFNYLREIIFNEMTKIYFDGYNYKYSMYKLDSHKGTILINHKPNNHVFLVRNLDNMPLTLNNTPKKDDVIKIEIYEKQNKPDELLNSTFFEFMRMRFPEKNMIYDSFSGATEVYNGTVDGVESISVLSRYMVGKQEIIIGKFLARDWNVSPEQQKEYFRLIREYATQQYSP